MPLNFPSSPTNGQTYTDDNSVVWSFDGVKWDVITGATKKQYSGVKVSVGATNFSLSSTETAISFTEENFDTDTYFNATFANKITVNKSGFYRINFLGLSSAAGSSYTVSVKKNGTTTLSTTTFTGNQTVNFDEIYELAINDYIQIVASEVSSSGSLLEGTFLEVTRVGLSTGTGVSSWSAFSGARVKLTSAFNTTTIPTAIAWSEAVFNQNADAIGNFYWNDGQAGRFTIKINGFYRISSLIKMSSTGTYTFTLRKNGSSTVSNVSGLEPNSTIRIDEIYELTADDYLEILASDSASVGSITTDSYFEITRIGV